MPFYKLLARDGRELQEIVAQSQSEAERVGRSRFADFAGAKAADTTRVLTERGSRLVEIRETSDRLATALREIDPRLSTDAARRASDPGGWQDSELNERATPWHLVDPTRVNARLLTTEGNRLQYEYECPFCRGSHRTPFSPASAIAEKIAYGTQRTPCGQGTVQIVPGAVSDNKSAHARRFKEALRDLGCSDAVAESAAADWGRR